LRSAADGCADDRDPVALEDAIEGASELRVAIVDQEPWPQSALVEIDDQVARLLDHPSSIGIAGTGQVLDPARPDRDEEEHIQPVGFRNSVSGRIGYAICLIHAGSCFAAEQAVDRRPA
jgi:hypothetical protein